MKPKKLYWWKSLISFIFVLLMMPLGHALMIIMEHVLNPDMLHYSALALGAGGCGLVFIGLKAKGDTRQTLWGLIGGLLFWTGWVEFLLQYYANRYGTDPQLDPVTGEIVTRPEYLLFPATIGFWCIIMLVYIIGSRSGCNFICWIQSHCLGRLRPTASLTRRTSLVTFMELIMIMWGSYIALMLCYDDHLLGDSHPVTLIFGAVCFISAIYIFGKQLRQPAWGANIRMAIPTVIFLWTPIEILGRNNLLKEIWIAPEQHTVAMTVILAVFLVVGIYLCYQVRKRLRN